MTRTLGRPYPLGATLDDTGCNFSIYSPDCPNLSLALFDKNDEFVTYKLENEYAGIKYTFVEGISAGQKYGFIVETEEGSLLLSDPYGKALSEPLHYQTPYTPEKSFGMAKCVVTDDSFDWQGIQEIGRASCRERVCMFV